MKTSEARKIRQARQQEWERAFAEATERGSREDRAAEWASMQAQARAEAVARDLRCAAGLPKHETPYEREQRVIAHRANGTCRDDADRLVFGEDAVAMKRARPEWSAERVAQELRDRGLGQRYGVQWTIRVAGEAIGA